MSTDGVSTLSAPPRDPKGPPPALARAVKKIKCAAMVAGLAKSWQGWAQDHQDTQDTIPVGWMPDSVLEDKKKPAVKLSVTPRVVAAAARGDGGIRTIGVTKSVQPSISECGRGGGDVVNAMRSKIQAAPEETKQLFLGNESPTRRRQMRAMQNAEGGGGGGGGGVQERKLTLLERKGAGSRSSSLDTEDSGLGEEAGLSDGNGEPARGEEQPSIKQPAKKAANRPKVHVSTMGDIKSRWQQWSVQHTEGQKLNPFSDEFDYDLAMSQRLRKGDEGYGRPKDGTKTAERGDRAHKHIHREMEEMVWIITDLGGRDSQGRVAVTFGRLFDRYVKISDKVVGILLRCRKHKMVDFEGEMLWKGQDDHVIITVREEAEPPV